MAHDIAKINGVDAMAFVGDRKAVWHGLGQGLGDGTVQWEVMLKAAQLDWEVVKKDVFSRQPVTNAVFPVPDIKAVHRTNDGAYLGTVGTGYELIQNREMFLYVDDLLQAENGAHYETAGALGNGSQLWALAKLPHQSVIQGTKDVTSNYLMFFGAHDGSSRNLVKLVRERVVCRNTLNIALGEAGKSLSFKHTKNVRLRMEEARKIWLGIHDDIRAQDEAENVLATRKMTVDSTVAVLNRLFPENKESKSDTRRRGIVEQVLALFESNDGDAVPEVRGTAYNLLNAVTEYADHYRGVRITPGRNGLNEGQVRAENALFGTGDKLKGSAMVALLEETVNAPVKESRIILPAPQYQNDGAFLKAMGIRG